jgi:hypothetical protein
MMRMTTVLPVLVAAAIALQGCATGGADGRPQRSGTIDTTGSTTVTVTTTATATVSVPGTGAGRSGSTGPARSDPGCTDITYADPWIAFEPALRDGDVLAIGERGWISTTHPLADIAVRGTAGAVDLSEQRAPTTIRCGQATSSVSWIEVAARAPGSVVITLGAKASTAKQLRVTVSAG